MVMIEQEFLSIQQFALWIGVHPNTVRRAIKSKRIDAFQVGSGKRSVWRIPKSEVSRMCVVELNKAIEEEIMKRMGK